MPKNPTFVILVPLRGSQELKFYKEQKWIFPHLLFVCFQSMFVLIRKFGAWEQSVLISGGVIWHKHTQNTMWAFVVLLLLLFVPPSVPGAVGVSVIVQLFRKFPLWHLSQFWHFTLQMCVSEQTSYSSLVWCTEQLTSRWDGLTFRACGMMHCFVELLPNT